MVHKFTQVSHQLASQQTVRQAHVLQIDGIHSDAGAERKSVMVMAATNCPWDLDEALRR